MSQHEWGLRPPAEMRKDEKRIKKIAANLTKAHDWTPWAARIIAGILYNLRSKPKQERLEVLGTLERITEGKNK